LSRNTDVILISYGHISTATLPSCATAFSADPGTNLVLYISPISIPLLISSYISKITRFVLVASSYNTLIIIHGNSTS
jgi:hypothetical protein